MNEPSSRSYLHFAIIGIAIILLAAGGAYAHYAILGEATAETATLANEMGLMKERLGATEAENEQLRSLLQSEAAENEEFGRRVEELTNTVGYLDKLSKTDRELLQKYSSVFFLSENFTPDPLVPISDEYLARSGSNTQIHGDVRPFLEKMMDDAKNAGVKLLVLSAYRSFGTQSSLKTSYKITYGAGTANKFSADQGYSEHQLGSTVDFSTPENPESLPSF
ncbi:MAG: D-alanyl-D-alanine carboxypeptidase family protein, partial [Minisyncoccia bacterium]